MTRASHLRGALVAHLHRSGASSDPRVLDAIGTVPRERFAEGVPLEVAYDDRALVLKSEADRVLSSISQPSMIAQMLGLLDVPPGAEVLEIGAGSGYTAALIAHLAGPHGNVTTIDIEPDLVTAANRRFTELNVRAHAYVDDADILASAPPQVSRVLVTAKATDISPAWLQRLGDGGRIVVPLDLGLGAEAAFAFVRSGDTLQSIGGRACVFLPLRGGQASEGRIFFRSSASRYDVSDVTFANARITVAPVRTIDESWLERYDVVVVRAHAAFGVVLQA